METFMSNSIYTINKGINKSIEFKGLRAQYIWYFAGGVLILMIVFSILYIIGINAFLCLTIVGAGGVLMGLKIYRWSNTYGEHGMMKALASRRTPKVLKSYSRSPFINLKSKDNGSNA